MNRKIKALGLALVAALALTAVVASTASAQFTSTKEHTIYLGAQKTETNDVISAGAGFGGITCEYTGFGGTNTASSSTMVLTPSYENCIDSFGRWVDIDNSSLTYTFTSGAGKGTLHVSGGMTLTVTSFGSVVCTVIIKSPQTNSGISYTNLSEIGVELTFHVKNLITTTSGGFFNCGVSNGEHKSGTYDGTTTLVGLGTDGSGARISVD